MRASDGWCPYGKGKLETQTPRIHMHRERPCEDKVKAAVCKPR